MDKRQKEELISDLKGKLDSAKAVILTDYTGLSVSEVNEMRNELRDAQVVYKVVKNTLAKRAAAGTQAEELAGRMEGPTGLVMGFDDAVTPAKAIVGHAKKQQKLKVRSGLIEGVLADEAMLKSIAALPSRDEMLSMMAAGFQAPLSKMARLLSASVARLGYALSALEKKNA